MKRLTIHILTLLLLASCCATIHEYPDRDGSTDVTIEVEFGLPPYLMYKEVTFDERLRPLERRLPETAAEPYTVADSLRPCIIAELRHGGARSRGGAVVTRRRFFSEELWSRHRASMTERLEPGSYTLLCWGDYVPWHGSDADTSRDEWLYATSDLTQITTFTSRLPSDPHTRNAQSACVELLVPERVTGREHPAVGGQPLPSDTLHATLARTQGRFRLVADDVEEFHAKTRSAPSRLLVRATYSMFVPTGYDVAQQEPTEYITSYSFTRLTALGDDPDGTELLTEYVFARHERQSYVQLSLDFLTTDGRHVNTVPDLRIPIYPGHETIVRGPLLTGDFQHKDGGGVNVDENFEGEYTIVVR